MKNRLIFAFLITLVFSLIVSCGSKESSRHVKAYAGARAPESILNVEFVKIPASVFTLNETKEGRIIDGAERSLEVMQSAFWISREPVSVSVYEMYSGKGRYPKNGLSFDGAEEFLDRLYQSTGLPVIIPTEAMFEAAVNAGAIVPESKYRYLVADGVGRKEDLKDDVFVDYRQPLDGDFVVTRTRYEKTTVERYRARSVNRIYLAVRTNEPIPEEMLRVFDLTVTETPAPCVNKPIKVAIGKETLEMIPVKGGEATLGGTEEQGRYAEADEVPLRNVILQDYMIAKTPVTVGQWYEVMGFYPVGNRPSEPRRPVVNVSWYDAQEFILKLREMTGMPFRLPSENEWEYAARGGKKTNCYVFAGSNNAQDVAVCTYKNKKGDSVRPSAADVASLKPNELGLYDMSGLVWEWVRSRYPGDESMAVQKGGSRLSTNVACRVSNRQGMNRGYKKDTFGLRVAL